MAAVKQETKTSKAGNVGIVPSQMTMDRCAQTGKVICPTMQRSAQGTLIVKTTLRFNKEKLSDAIRWTNVSFNMEQSCFPSEITLISMSKTSVCIPQPLSPFTFEYVSLSVSQNNTALLRHKAGNCTHQASFQHVPTGT